MRLMLMTLYRLFRSVGGALRDPEFSVLAGLTASVLALGSVFYHFVEGWRWLDALYFSVITLTTVGYGDFTPHTDAGKLFTIVYIFVGLGILLGFLTAIGGHSIAEHKKWRTAGTHAEPDTNAKI